MTLWILRPLEERPREGDPWVPWYDKVFAAVVRAPTEQDARAAVVGADECLRWPNPWLDPALTSCVALNPDGPTESILEECHDA